MFIRLTRGSLSPDWSVDSTLDRLVGPILTFSMSKNDPRKYYWEAVVDKLIINGYVFLFEGLYYYNGVFYRSMELFPANELEPGFASETPVEDYSMPPVVSMLCDACKRTYRLPYIKHPMCCVADDCQGDDTEEQLVCSQHIEDE